MTDEKKDDNSSITEVHYMNQVRYLANDDLRAQSYEPKRAFRWIFDVDGLDQFVLYTIQAPRWTKQHGWTDFYVSMYDPVVPSASQKVYHWISSGTKRHATLVCLDPVGTIVEKWAYEGLEIMSARFGDLDYSKPDPKIIHICLKPEKVTLEF